MSSTLTAGNATSGLTISSGNTGVITLRTGSGSGTNAAIFDASQNFNMNSGYGSVATAFGCRAWVNFNGTGVVAIRASGNVSSITDNGTGDYTANFTTALSNANYAVGFATGATGATTTTRIISIKSANSTDPPTLKTASALRFISGSTSTAALIDMEQVNVIIFR